MPLIHRSYLDLSIEQRKAGAKVVRARLRAALGNPSLTPAQIKQLQDQVLKINMWEAGTLAQMPEPVPEPA
jgi:hypothetical protein